MRSKEATVKETIAEEKVGFTNTVKETIAENYTVEETVTNENVGFTIQSRKLLQIRR